MKKSELSAVLSRHIADPHSHVVLQHANLRCLRLRDASPKWPIDLSGADLWCADCTNALLRGANFADADVSMANFTGATLTGASFAGADIGGAIFTNANLAGADFTGAVNTESADFTGASLRWVTDSKCRS